MNKCTKRCQNPCYDFKSVQSVVTSTTESEANDKTQIANILYNAAKNEFTQEFVEETVADGVTVKIYFSTIDVSVITTGETTEFMTFISDVGGQLGKIWGIIKRIISD